MTQANIKAKKQFETDAHNNKPSGHGHPLFSVEQPMDTLALCPPSAKLPDFAALWSASDFAVVSPLLH
jgi:hypothetical protein